MFAEKHFMIAKIFELRDFQRFSWCLKCIFDPIQKTGIMTDTGFYDNGLTFSDH